MCRRASYRSDRSTSARNVFWLFTMKNGMDWGDGRTCKPGSLLFHCCVCIPRFADQKAGFVECAWSETPKHLVVQRENLDNARETCHPSYPESGASSHKRQELMAWISGQVVYQTHRSLSILSTASNEISMHRTPAEASLDIRVTIRGSGSGPSISVIPPGRVMNVERINPCSYRPQSFGELKVVGAQLPC